MEEEVSDRWIWDDELVSMVSKALGENKTVSDAMELISDVEQWNKRRIVNENEKAMAAFYATGIIDGLASCVFSLKAAGANEAAKLIDNVLSKVTQRYLEEDII